MSAIDKVCNMNIKTQKHIYPPRFIQNIAKTVSKVLTITQQFYISQFYIQETKTKGNQKHQVLTGLRFGNVTKNKNGTKSSRVVFLMQWRLIDGGMPFNMSCRV